MNLGSLFGQSIPPLVGLDISTSGVRLVELADAGKGELRLESIRIFDRVWTRGVPAASRGAGDA